MILLIKYRESGQQETQVALPLQPMCNLDKAKRIADDLHFLGKTVICVQVIGDSDNVLYQTI